MSDQLYKAHFAEWLNEQNIRMEEFKRTIKTNEAIIESTTKQLGYHLQAANVAIEDYNTWAKENGETLYPLFDNANGERV